MWHIYLVVVTTCLVTFMVNLILNLKSLHQLGHDEVEISGPFPLISILVPARNEAANIAACLDSLSRQDYPNYEILVLDDNSTDSTAAIVQGKAALDPRIRLLRGKPLPEGWAGKPFACHQLASEAKGEWLLFTDADTIHDPAMLRSALAYSQHHQLSLLSGFPLQHTVSFSQRVVVPAMYFIILSFFPLWWLQSSHTARPGLSIGQFLFVFAADYREIGGHEAVKSRILEDVSLGLEMTNRGHRQGVVDLSHMVACRMYEGVGQLWEGFTKWTYSLSSLYPVALFFLMVAAVGLFLVPFVLVAWHLSPVLGGVDWFTIIVAQVLVILLMRALVDHHFGHSLVYTLSHPAGISFMLLSTAFGAAKRATGAGINWKQRRYPPTSGIG
jgi:chlorobactene glucosyltransferase